MAGLYIHVRRSLFNSQIYCGGSRRGPGFLTPLWLAGPKKDYLSHMTWLKRSFKKITRFRAFVRDDIPCLLLESSPHVCPPGHRQTLLMLSCLAVRLPGRLELWFLLPPAPLLRRFLRQALGLG